MLLALVFSLPAANAHSQLASSTPADGAVLDAAPDLVTLVFNEDLLPDANTMAIVDASGNVVSSTPVQPVGPQVSIPWPQDLPAGEYQVSYRVVSGDGHPVLGAISFSYAAQRAPAGGSGPAATPSQPAPEAPGPSSSMAALVLIAGAVGATATAIALVLRSRKPRGS
jgi:methionine-rich copper-binding protein CopC